MPIIAFAHLKGGVGKTTTAVNIAHLASEERSVLLCDLDAQASASWLLRIRPAERHDAKAFVKGGKRLQAGIRETDYPNLFVLPADFSYRHLDIKLDREKHRKRHLAEVLRPLAEEFDLAIIDSPPGITLEAENIVRAADHLFVPVIPSALSIDSFVTFAAHFGGEGPNPHITAFFNLVDRRRKLHRDMVDTPPESLGSLLETVIPSSSQIESMGARREPVTAFAPNSPSSASYRSLWEEIRRVAGII
jgi:chromosome partitioning protein